MAQIRPAGSPKTKAVTEAYSQVDGCAGLRTQDRHPLAPIIALRNRRPAMRYANDRITRNRWMTASRSLNEAPRDRAFGLAEQLHASRLVARALHAALKGYHIGVDFSDTANVHVTADKVILYVRTPGQKSKLRQLMRRIENAIAQTGLVRLLDIQVRPVNATIPESALPKGEPRKGSRQSAESIEKAAQSLPEDSSLRKKLERLARTLRQIAED